MIKFKFNSETLCLDFELFEQMEVVESLYKGDRGTLKFKARADANNSSGVNVKGGEDNFPKGYAKGRAGKNKTSFSDHLKGNKLVTSSCMIQGTRHSYKECNFLR